MIEAGDGRDTPELPRLLGELADPGRLDETAATARARGRHGVAAVALERLCDGSGADVGAIVAALDGGLALEAAHGLSRTSEAALAATMRELVDTGSPWQALLLPGQVFASVAPEGVPFPDPVAVALAGERIASIVVAGLRVGDRLVGFLALGSRSAAWLRPGDEMLLQAATRVAASLETATLVERLERGLAQERRLTAQLETLIGLTQLPEGDLTEEALARFLLQRVVAALGSIGGFVAAHDPGARRLRLVATSSYAEPLQDLIRTERPEAFKFWRRLTKARRACLIDIDGSQVARETHRRLRNAGYSSYAAVPIVRDEVLVGALICHFDRPATTVVADERTLDAVTRIVNIAFANVRLGEGLAAAAASERSLTAEVRALQELTLLGSTTDDLETLARQTVAAIVRALDASGGGYLQIDQAAGAVRPLAWFGRPSATLPAATPVAVSDWPPFAQLTEGQAVQVNRPPGGTAASGATSREVTLPLTVDGHLVAALQLIWDGSAPRTADEARFLEPVARIASISLANFRLRAELLQRAVAQRALGQRLDTLNELTRVGELATSLPELGHRTASLVREALGARAVCYLLVVPGRRFTIEAVAGEPGPFRLWLQDVPIADLPGGARLVAGRTPVRGDFLEGHSPQRLLTLARSAGIGSFATVPILTGEGLAGALVCLFEQPAGDLEVDAPALDSVARIAGIAMANFRLRERLVVSEERYRTLFEQSPDALIVSALDGTVLDVNEAATRLYGTDRGSLLGRHHGGLVDTDEAELERRTESVRKQGRGTFRSRGRRPDGSEFPMEVEIRLVELGGQRRNLSLVRDLSGQDRLQRELLQAQKMEALGQLVSGVAHELNNPLAAIVGLSELMRTDERLPEDMRHDAGLLSQEADRTRRIVQNLLDFARQRPPERFPTPIRTLIKSVLELQSYALTSDRIIVHVDIPDTLPDVDLDRSQLQQVLLNLTINAIQAIRSQGPRPPAHLWLEAIPVEPSPGRPAAVRIAVRDDGPGVPEAVRARLFDPFFTTKRPGEGTGLGLSVSFGIVAAHGGRLWYEPGPAGLGSSFLLELPIRAAGLPDDPRGLATSPAPPASAAPPAPTPVVEAPAEPAVAGLTAAVPAGTGSVAGGRPRVLVLDDESSIRFLLRKALTTAGMECVPFQDGHQAVAAVRDGPFQAMLMDHRMPGMTGTEFYDAAVALRPELASRAVLMSGDVLNPDLRSFAAQRGIRLLAKPFDIDTVTRVVREAVG